MGSLPLKINFRPENVLDIKIINIFSIYFPEILFILHQGAPEWNHEQPPIHPEVSLTLPHIAELDKVGQMTGINSQTSDVCQQLLGKIGPNHDIMAENNATVND